MVGVAQRDCIDIAWRINPLMRLGCKIDGEPGARTIWLGLQEIAVFVEGARYARQLDVA